MNHLFLRELIYVVIYSIMILNYLPDIAFRQLSVYFGILVGQSHDLTTTTGSYWPPNYHLSCWRASTDASSATAALASAPPGDC